MQQRRRPPVTLSPVTVNNTSNRSLRQSNRSMPSAPTQCFGCSQPMHNQFISSVLDHLWHPECVRCFVCRALLNEQCYSREGKLYCKDDFIKKYIHRCFACQNLVKCDELIRRIRTGRIYHAECFVCVKCKGILQDDDISELLKVNGTALNDLDCLCQTCLNPDKKTNETIPLSHKDENKIITDNDVSATMNGKLTSKSDAQEQKLPILNNNTVSNESVSTNVSTSDNHVNDKQSMDVDEAPTASKSPIRERSSSPSSSIPVPAKTNGRQSKLRQSTSSNGSKRSPAKTKATTPVSRQKQTNKTERKGRSPATRSKASNATSTVQRRSSNRRAAKTARYRKRSFSSGSDEDETEDDEDDDQNDADFAEEDNMQDDEQENACSPVTTKGKPSTTSDDKKSESEPKPTSAAPPILPPPPPPPATTTNPSLISQAKMSEPLSLLSGLAANPMSISSIMKPDMAPSFMPPNFNPAFPTSQFLPPGFPLQPRLPMPPPPPPSVPINNTQAQSGPTPDLNRSSNSGNASDMDSLDRSSSPSQMDVSTSVEPGTPARPVSSPKGSRQSIPSTTATTTHTTTTTTQKPSALSSLLEFGTVPPSNLTDIRSSSGPTNPFPFPFVTPGPGVPFSPQAAAGMATFYRPPFGVPPANMPLDMTQANSNGSKKKPETADNNEIVSQNILDDSSSSSSPKKKKQKPNARKQKNKTNGTDGEHGIDDDNPSPPPSKKKKQKKSDTTADNASVNDSEESKITNGNTNNHSHNLLAQMGLINPQFMSPMPPTSTNGKTPPTNPQQAQLAAMYSMAPHFAAYNAFPGAFNPAFAAAAAYASGYPTPYGFHPAFTAPNPGQPFPFMPPTPAGAMPPMNNTSNHDDKASSNGVSDSRPVKPRKKSTTNGEKKKSTTPRTNKKKGAAQSVPSEHSALTENDSMTAMSSTDVTSQNDATSETMPSSNKRRMSESEDDDSDEQHQQSQSQTANGKSGNESDDSADEGDRSLSTTQSLNSSSMPTEKKGARTTIKPQQLDVLCKAFDSCSKPNKAQREQLVEETGLSLRVIQVWFQNKRSKERKGKPSKEKEMPLDDDEGGEDSQTSPATLQTETTPVPPSESAPIVNEEN